MRTTLYNITLDPAAMTATIEIGEDRYEFTQGQNPWDYNCWANGLKSKIGDGAAIPRDPVTGRSAPDSDKQARMRAIAARLAEGEWSGHGEGGSPTGGLLYLALIELGASPERARDKLAGMSSAQKAAMRANSRIAPVIDRIRAARAKTNVNADDLINSILD